MRKVVEFLVNKRIYIFCVMIVFTVIAAIAMQHVVINTDLIKYLPKDSDMRAGLKIMNEEFPDKDQPESFEIMFDDLSADEKIAVYDELLAHESIDTVDYDINSDKFNKDNHTLYVLNSNVVGVDDTLDLIDAIEDQFEDRYDICTYWGNKPDNVLDFLIPVALVILVIVLFIMSDSYIEPLLLISTIGIAIILNMGTNALLDSVSDMTYSIAAVLQLILSIDYSIILFHRYAQEKALPDKPDKVTAMKNALYNAFGSITSSSLTTFVGLLALLLMTFTIGFDMGVVLAKGVLLSLICIFTVLPSLILWADKLIDKTTKKYRKVLKEVK